MIPTRTEPPDTDTSQDRNRTENLATTVTERSPGGTVLVVLGGALLARAIWSHRRGRALLQAAVGASLVGVGLWKRRFQRESSSERPDGARFGTVEERLESHRVDVNPRGTGDEPDVETETRPDEGSIQFTDEQTDRSRSKPNLDDPAPRDPRLDDTDDVTEVDLSEAAMADEASEAVGPAPEQAQPAQTEATEPEPSPEEDVSHTDVDTTNRTDESPDSEETSTGASATADTPDSGDGDDAA